MAVYQDKREIGQGVVRTVVRVLVPVLLLTAGEAVAQLTSEGNQLWRQGSDNIAGQPERGDNLGNAVAAGDFNSDGFGDLAIGVLLEDVGGEENAGAVNVIYGGRPGLAALGNQIWHQDSVGILGEAEGSGGGVLGFDPFGDEFGDAVAAGDFNNDGFADLAIGVHAEDIEQTLSPDEDAAGAVNVIYGGPAGLASPGNQIWHQDSDGIAGAAEVNDLFGSALAAGDFNNDGFADLAIGVPLESIGGIQSAGAVNVIYGGPGGLASPGNQIWHQDSDGIGGVAEDDDLFGTALAASDFNNDGFEDLAIGVEEDVRGEQDVGVVHVIYGGPGGLAAAGNQVWGQDSVGIGGAGDAGDNFGEALAAGDFNNDGFADLAIGVAGEDNRAGAVNVIYGGADGLAAAGNQVWGQASDGIAGTARAGDNFGRGLTTGDFNGDGFEDLAIGVPGDDNDAGAVNVIYGGPDGLAAPGNQLWNQDSDGIAGTREQGDNFGFALAGGDFNNDGLSDLAIGVPGEDTNAGAVNVIYGAEARPGSPQFSSEGVVSAASFLPGAAPVAIMSLFGVNLALGTEIADELPLPTALGGTSVRVTTQPVVGQGVPQVLGSALAPLFFASPGQINFLMPDVPLGRARITVTTAFGGSFSSTIDLERVAPALFSADASGSGVAAAQFLKVAADGTRTQGFVFDPDTLDAVPIDLGSEQDQVFLLLFGTGIRGFRSGVTARVGGVGVPVLGAVPQGQFEGLDQVNIGPLPRSLIASIAPPIIVLTVDGQQTNPVLILLEPERPGRRLSTPP